MSAEAEGIPSASLPLSASAPGKCIVFGEHAVVHGQPELLFALDLRTQLVLRSSDETTLNGSTEEARANAYLTEAIRQMASHSGPIGVTSVSRLPKGSGLGSSAAFVAALAAGLSAVQGGTDRPGLAQRAFSIERGAQGVGSPGDTSAAVAGGFLAVNSDRGAPLWEVTEGSERWTVRRIADPGWNWVVAFSRIPHDTGHAVRCVADRLAAGDRDAILGRFRSVAERGIDAVRDEDRIGTGAALRENQALLHDLGVTLPRLAALLDAARPTCDGEKITGAGMGGSIVALPKLGEEIATWKRLQRAGAEAYVVRPSPDGARLL